MIMNPHYTNIHVARSDQGNVEYQVFAFSRCLCPGVCIKPWLQVVMCLHHNVYNILLKHVEQFQWI